MTTNGEWLEYLANNAPDELAAWFDAEHVETKERALDGDTDAQNADSREQLEADVRGTVPEWHVDMVIGWLDRQAAITERDATKRHELFCETCEATTDKQIAELTAERDEWKSRWETDKAQFDAILAERELYREALSELLDTITEGMGKVSAILDVYDEGMA